MSHLRLPAWPSEGHSVAAQRQILTPSGKHLPAWCVHARICRQQPRPGATRSSECTAVLPWRWPPSLLL